MARKPKGLRATSKGKPGRPAQDKKCLASKFVDHLAAARVAMEQLAGRHEPDELQRRGFRLYEQFRPSVPAGESGWGALGELHLKRAMNAAT